MRIHYFGLGAWGYCLAHLLASRGHEVLAWSRNSSLVSRLAKGEKHPYFAESEISSPLNLKVTDRFDDLLKGADLFIESVTTSGIRFIAERMRERSSSLEIPFVLTSKGIEQESCLLPYEIILDVFGQEAKQYVGMLSGPGFAREVMKQLPTAVVCSSSSWSLMEKIRELFSSSFFRVYPNADICGISFGGAVKNVIAMIAGAIDALELGVNTKATLVTRGLHEMKRLCVLKGGNMETLHGLAGMGDLIMTCFSPLSRNYRFGYLIGTGKSPEEARREIGMAIEGRETTYSIYKIAQKTNVKAPIIEAAYSVLYDAHPIRSKVHELMNREVREERL